MRLFITGDSHTGTLEMARRQVEAAGGLPGGVTLAVRPLGPGLFMRGAFWAPRDDHAEITEPEFRLRLRRLPPAGEQFDAYGLCMPLWFGRALRAFVADGLVPAGTADGAVGRPVSEALLRRIVLADQASTLQLAQFLRTLGHPVFAIDAPALFRHNGYLTRLPAARLLDFVARHRAIMRAELDRLEIPVVERPAGVTDAEGFMLDAYRRDDPDDRHHANAAFGALMLHAIAQAAPRLCRLPA